MTTRYFLRSPNEAEFIEVSKERYVAAERAAGFRNTLGQPDEPATSAFNAADGTRGTTVFDLAAAMQAGTVYMARGSTP
ncbi:hypothetical protein AB0B94_31155 [Micromonospora sp. NPDC048986]|uniref:hypothetical protein n=1 Tax=Micromonospora sp. NPDC048986 TaxID=3155644 RepID=UPI0034008EBA